MLNFTVGPVQTWPEILEIGGKQVPYFRNQSFSKIMLENEQRLRYNVLVKVERSCCFCA